ncbi:MAG: DUF4097 family beta strand repeat protein [Clostridia bacterium]|nr:DUF4097 family beta strand repeat protein [Clostridia bacterium]
MKKVFLIIAAVLVTLGIVLTGAAFAIGSFSFKSLDTGEVVTETATVDEAFSKIEVSSSIADVVFERSVDGNASVVCVEREARRFDVKVENGTLKVTQEKRKNWFADFNFFSFKKTSATLRLPAESYESLKIESDTGDISVPKDFSFGSAGIQSDTGGVTLECPVSGLLKVKTSTGDIKISGTTAGELDLKASTGRITVDSVACAGRFAVSVSTGKTVLTSVTCKDLVSNGSTGTLTLTDVIASGRFDIERDTGDVKFNRCDAAEIKVETDTGDVTGTLLTEKVFITKTDTGKVSVPSAASGGRCEIETDTGDIKISIAQ